MTQVDWMNNLEALVVYKKCFAATILMQMLFSQRLSRQLPGSQLLCSQLFCCQLVYGHLGHLLLCGLPYGYLLSGQLHYKTVTKQNFTPKQYTNFHWKTVHRLSFQNSTPTCTLTTFIQWLHTLHYSYSVSWLVYNILHNLYRQTNRGNLHWAPVHALSNAMKRQYQIYQRISYMQIHKHNVSGFSNFNFRHKVFSFVHIAHLYSNGALQTHE